MRFATQRLVTLLACSALVGACKSATDSGADGGVGGTGGTGGSGGSDADAGDGTRDVSIQFAAVVGGDDARCDRTYRLGTPSTDAQLLDLRFYVSGLRLIDAEGDETPVELDQDTPFQTDDVALLDFEDASGACSGVGTEQTNDRVRGTVPEGDYVGMAFELGVPFELNHDDPLTSDAPLDIQSLFWNWLPGHKFVRIDLMPEGGDASAASRWNFHLGSTMCVQDVPDGGPMNPMAPPSGACGRPNLPSYEFSSFDVDTDTLELDLSALFAGSDITSNLGGMTLGCQSFPPDQPDCERIFSNLGLDYSAGTCENDCEDQTVFTVR